MGDVVAGRWPNPADPESMDEVTFLSWLLDHMDSRPTATVHYLAIDVYLCPDE